MRRSLTRPGGVSSKTNQSPYTQTAIWTVVKITPAAACIRRRSRVFCLAFLDVFLTVARQDSAKFCLLPQRRSRNIHSRIDIKRLRITTATIPD